MTEQFLSTGYHYVEKQFTDPVWCYTNNISTDRDLLEQETVQKPHSVADWFVFSIKTCTHCACTFTHKNYFENPTPYYLLQECPGRVNICHWSCTERVHLVYKHHRAFCYFLLILNYAGDSMTNPKANCSHRQCNKGFC